LNLVEQVSDAHVEPISVLPIQIAIPHETFKQRLLKTFFQPKVREMAIDKTPIHVQVQN
jgi:hypothetical protein